MILVLVEVVKNIKSVTVDKQLILMYQSFKLILKWVLPSNLRWKIAPTLRWLYAGIFFRGDSRYCNICRHSFSRFIELESGDLLCPYCGSLPRSRRLWQFLNQNDLLQGKILHFFTSQEYL